MTAAPQSITFIVVSEMNFLYSEYSSLRRTEILFPKKKRSVEKRRRRIRLSG
jgi:hypothetical protein